MVDAAVSAVAVAVDVNAKRVAELLESAWESARRPSQHGRSQAVAVAIAPAIAIVGEHSRDFSGPGSETDACPGDDSRPEVLL